VYRWRPDKSPARRQGGAWEIASIWELAIKIQIGKLDGDPSQIAAAIETSGFVELPVSSQHAARVASLPDIQRDPFDRLLMAQALTEPLVLLTADRQLAAYRPIVHAVGA
jgi:PIN domain nuclease of toxin-antitoxin system